MGNHAMENALLELEREGFINLGDFTRVFEKKIRIVRKQRKRCHS